MSTIAIVGAGPAGMLAAHAVVRMGHDVTILAPREPSKISRVQCLWAPTPGIKVEGYWLDVLKRGNRETYAKRLYGRGDAPCSWDRTRIGRHRVDPLDAVYAQLWELYKDRLINIVVDTKQLLQLLYNFPLVINTAPANAFCMRQQQHNFALVETQILKIDFGDEADLGHAFTMINGGPAALPGENWFRYSSARGEQVYEYADNEQRDGVSYGFKPINNDCDCWQSIDMGSGVPPRQVRRVGRYGQWKQGVMNHHAFQDTVSILANAGFGKLL
jgi:hypothetical protein